MSEPRRNLTPMFPTPRRFGGLALLVVLLLSPAVALAQRSATMYGHQQIEEDNPASSANQALGQVDFVQNLGDTVPGDVAFTDEHGKRVTLNQLADDKPVVLMMGYYHCRMLCDVVIRDLADTAKRVPYKPGEDYQIVFISIDPKETPADALAKQNDLVGKDRDKGWHLLTGDKPAIKRVADAIGFKYAYDPKSNQYAHPAGAVVLTPGLKISRYLFGMRFAARDLKFAVIESSGGKVGTTVDRVLLRCYCYDPTTGRYGFTIMAALDVAAIATVLGLGTMIGLLSYKHRRQRLTEDDLEHPRPTGGPA